MRFHGMLRNAGLLLTTCATLAFLNGCSEDTTQPDKSGTFYSAVQNIGNGTAKAYVTLDKDGNPTEVGVRMSETSLDGLPDTLLSGLPSQDFMITFPAEASATVFNHVMINWNFHGHEPAMIFDVPHFDMHFYMTDMTEVQAILPTDPNFQTKAEHLPEAKYVPQDYFTPPPVQAVRMMGVHWLDSTKFPAPGTFSQVFIYGSWDGAFTFLEPMITRAYLLTKPTVQEDLKLPSAYAKSGYYPTKYNIRFDETAKEFVISLSGMTMRQAS